MSVTPDEGRTHWHGCEQERGHHACALAELARLRAELETERMRLAACGVASGQNTPTTVADRMTEIKHPTYGTLDGLLAAIGSDVRNGYHMRIGQQGTLAWFSDQYALARHQAEAQEPPA